MFRLIALFFLAAAGFADMTQIFDLKEIERELDQAGPNTLVVFDVDEVLITTEDHFIHPYSYSTLFPIVDQYAKKIDRKELEEIMSLCFLHPKRVLIEGTTPELIQQIQKREIKTIALTHCEHGPLGLIPSVEVWRIEDLQSHGIDFSASFKDHPRLVLTELKSTKVPSPLFQQGILFSKGYTKGQVLKAFLERIDFHPSKILFIDDSHDNLESMEKELQALKIPHRIFHYTGASRFAKPLDKELIQFQVDHLFHNREWLSDVEAKKRMKP